jgi:DNA-binding PadR family transcriptional regulator
MQRTLHYVWPRAESRLYEEPKQLVEQGLAQAEKSFVGKRSRTTYTITESGRQALAAWLSTPSSPPTLECESIVRVLYADHGTLADLAAAIGVVQREAAAMQQRGRAIAAEYQQGGAPLQERAYLNALLFDFLWRYSTALGEWAAAAQTEITRWQDLTAKDKTEYARQVFAEHAHSAGDERE